MAKLYWRLKVNGKWTWLAATEDNTIEDAYEIELIRSLRYVEESE